MQQRGETALAVMPDALRDLPRSLIPLNTDGVLGIDSLRAFGNSPTTGGVKGAAMQLDFTMPPSLGALMEGLAGAAASRPQRGRRG